MAHPYATGTLLLIGVVFLSLNALAVSARPGEFATAEQSITANASTPAGTASGPIETLGSPVSVPVPPPRIEPVMVTAGRPTLVQPSLFTYRDTPSAGPGNGVTNPTVSAEGIAGPAPGEGLYPPTVDPAAIPPGSDDLSGMVAPGTSPAPIPPITPSPGKMSPGPVPPYGVTPVDNGL